MGAADPERCWWSTALYWVWDQERKDEGSRLCGTAGVEETWADTAEITGASVELDPHQGTL